MHNPMHYLSLAPLGPNYTKLLGLPQYLLFLEMSGRKGRPSKASKTASDVEMQENNQETSAEVH